MTAARVVQSGLVKTASRFRPSPSMMCLPGLTSRPWHDAGDPVFREWTSRLEARVPAIRQEYLALKQHGVPSDYVPSGEHKLGPLAQICSADRSTTAPAV